MSSRPSLTTIRQDRAYRTPSLLPIPQKSSTLAKLEKESKMQDLFATRSPKELSATSTLKNRVDISEIYEDPDFDMAIQVEPDSLSQLFDGTESSLKDPDIDMTQQVPAESLSQLLEDDEFSFLKEKYSEKDVIGEYPQYIGPTEPLPPPPAKKPPIKTTFDPKTGRVMKRRFAEAIGEDGKPQKKARRELDIPEGTTETTVPLSSSGSILPEKRT